MVEIVPPGVHIDFLGRAKRCMAFSMVVISIGLSAIVWRSGSDQGSTLAVGRSSNCTSANLPTSAWCARH